MTLGPFRNYVYILPICLSIFYVNVLLQSYAMHAKLVGVLHL